MTPMIYDRREAHESDAMRSLARLREIPQSAPDECWPSTAELQRKEIFGLRPVNRLVDLRKGKFNGVRYDIERIACGHGVFRWRLHWPNRPGYPKNDKQEIIPWEQRERVPTDRQGRPPAPIDDLPLFARRP